MFRIKRGLLTNLQITRTQILAVLLPLLIGAYIATGLFASAEERNINENRGENSGMESRFAGDAVNANSVAFFGIANATATVSAPGSVPLGQPFGFSVQFSNISGFTGYGPYINVFMPSGGADGTSGGGTDDGYNFSSATYLGVPLTPTIISCPSGGTVVSPLTGLMVSCPVTSTGRPSQFISLQLPFGSVTAGQPLESVVINATMSNLADVGTPLPISASAGFIYGDMPTGSMPSESIRVTQNVAPSLFSVTKTHSGSPSIEVTGPNYPRTYTITANMPAGLTATNIVIEDVLPNRIVYQGVSGAGISVISQPAIGSVVTPPNNLLKISVPASGVPITVNFYVPENDSSGSPIIDPLSGAAFDD